MKPILVSGIQPSGRLHIGNFLGALKNFVELQNSGKYDCYFFIADLHALTENPNPKDLKENIINLAADFLAAGLDPKKSIIFQQSQSPAQANIAWILNTITPKGELERMTQFKEKSGDRVATLIEAVKGLLEIDAKKEYGEDFIKKLGDEFKDIVNESIKKSGSTDRVENYVRATTNAGLFNYPVLMAADILFCDASFVPVGNDQDQHLELTRMLAKKFNNKFGKTFIEPKALYTPTPRVMSFDDPSKKMSKSRPQGCLFIDDSPEEIKKKIARAVTDSDSKISYDPVKKPGLSNLLGIYAALKNIDAKNAEKEFAGKSYAEFKSTLADLVSNYFADFRKKKKELLAKPELLKGALSTGSKQAAAVAEKKIQEVKEKIGIAL